MQAKFIAHLVCIWSFREFLIFILCNYGICLFFQIFSASQLSLRSEYQSTQNFYVVMWHLFQQVIAWCSNIFICCKLVTVTIPTAISVRAVRKCITSHFSSCQRLLTAILPFKCTWLTVLYHAEQIPASFCLLVKKVHRLQCCFWVPCCVPTHSLIDSKEIILRASSGQLFCKNRILWPL